MRLSVEVHTSGKFQPRKMPWTRLSEGYGIEVGDAVVVVVRESRVKKPER